MTAIMSRREKLMKLKDDAVKGLKIAKDWMLQFASGVLTVAALFTLFVCVADFIFVDLMHKQRNPMYYMVFNFWVTVGNGIKTNLISIKDVSFEWLHVTAPGVAAFLLALKRQIAIEITYVCMRIINYLDVLGSFKEMATVGVLRDLDIYGNPN